MSEPEGFRRDFRSYLIGLLLAVTLTAAAFGLVAWGGIGRATALAGVAILALVQVVVHLRYFLHIDLSQQKREDLQLILFSTLLLILMAGGTIWLLENLAGRMMVMPMNMAD
jgi:cytochrome o ubiquinol oxidase operon protein cyoD